MHSVRAFEHAKHDRLAASAAAALTLCSCGGGGGYEAATVPPISPAPLLGALTIVAPARASFGQAPTHVFADAASPNFSTGPAAGTIFPRLQTSVALTSKAIEPDANVNAVGGTATVQNGDLVLNISGGASGRWDSSLDWTRAGWWAVGPTWDW